MRNSKKKSKKNKTKRRLIYTDEAKRIMREIQKLKSLKKRLKNG